MRGFPFKVRDTSSGTPLTSLLSSIFTSNGTSSITSFSSDAPGEGITGESFLAVLPSPILTNKYRDTANIRAITQIDHLFWNSLSFFISPPCNQVRIAILDGLLHFFHQPVFALCIITIAHLLSIFRNGYGAR